MKIGIVDLDTSHPANWVPIIRDLGHAIAGLYDHGDVHPDGYAAEFAREHSIERVFQSLEEMAGQVDCAILHACNWDEHVRRGRPFVEAGKSILIDKPLAGNLADLRQLADWADGGARISGGSSLRFCLETRQYLARDPEERGVPHTAVCGCGVDEFNYGIHAYSLLAGIMGTGAVSVRHLGQGDQRRLQVSWPDGRAGILVIGEVASWLPFHATVVSERSAEQFIADSGQLYRAQLEAVLPYLAGDADEPPIAMADLMEPELWALAARRSWQEGDREVTLAELDEQEPGYDGAEFASFYRRQRYPDTYGG